MYVYAQGTRLALGRGARFDKRARTLCELYVPGLWTVEQHYTSSLTVLRA